MNYIIKVSQVIYCIYAFTLFLAIMLVLFPLILFASFLGKIRGGNLIYRLCRFWADAWMLLIGIRHTNIYEQHCDISKQYVFVSNHISYLDIPVMMKAVRKQKIRILGKSETAKIPVFGFIYRHAVVMVDRKNAGDRIKSIHILRSVLKKNISIFICPEGTFNETGLPLKSFYDGAFKLAIEMQTPVKPVLFLDTYDRFNYKSIFSLTPGRSRAVFLEETDVSGLSLQDVGDLKHRIFLQMEDALTRYHAGWIKK